MQTWNVLAVFIQTKNSFTKKCFCYNSSAANKGGGKSVCMNAYIQQVI